MNSLSVKWFLKGAVKALACIGGGNKSRHALNQSYTLNTCCPGGCVMGALIVHWKGKGVPLLGYGC